jgi:hypothetical protein
MAISAIEAKKILEIYNDKLTPKVPPKHEIHMNFKNQIKDYYELMEKADILYPERNNFWIESHKQNPSLLMHDILRQELGKIANSSIKEPYPGFLKEVKKMIK